MVNNLNSQLNYDKLHFKYTFKSFQIKCKICRLTDFNLGLVLSKVRTVLLVTFPVDCARHVN